MSSGGTPGGGPGPGAGCEVQLSVDGHLDAHWSPWFDGLDIVREPDGTTTLSGQAADQAALHGLLAKVRDIGADLISLDTRAPCGP